MSKSRWTPPKYNGTDLKHRQRLLMLICLCISADLLMGGLLHEKKLPFLILSGLFFVLAFVSRNDPNQESSGNFRIAGFALLFLGMVISLTILFSWLWIVGLFELLGLILFAAWPYRKRILKAFVK
ncbi:MAG: hypothetical protein IKO68_02950 [Oscillospiraceae bacterium]|nr:hypothetical protein [Oscillospiraceae bacterium]MBR4655541.1 hypothetical protein [Oscillospiraceae bacterium]